MFHSIITIYFSNYEIYEFDVNHTCSDVTDEYTKCKFTNFIKKFVEEQSDLNVQTLGSIYDRLITHAIDVYGYKEISINWPDKNGILRHIKYFKNKLRPSRDPITIPNKAAYKFPADAIYFQEEQIMYTGENNKRGVK